MTSWLVLLLLLALLALALSTMALAVHQRKQEIAWLEQHGTRILATVVNTQPVRDVGPFQKQTALMQHVTAMQPNVDRDMEHRYELVAQWIAPQSQQRYMFKRRYYGSHKTRYASGESVEVLLDLHHPRRYYVFLPSSPDNA